MKKYKLQKRYRTENLSKVFVCVVLVVIALAIAVGVCSCKSPRNIQATVDTVAVHDTTTVYVHDTTLVIDYVHDTVMQYVHDTMLATEIRHDSVDRYVEKFYYIDTLGTWHEREIEHVTHYIYRQSDQYKVKEAEYKSIIAEMDKQYTAKESEYTSRITELEKQLSEKESVQEVKKPLTWWEKTQIYGFWVLFAALIITVIWKYRKVIFLFLKRKF